MTRATGFLGAAALLLAPSLLAAACAGSAASARPTCGVPGPAGGPPVIDTRDAELCEAARLRTAEALAALPGLAPERAELLRDRTWSWGDARSLERLLARVRDEAGPEIADAVERAVREVREHSRRPVRADCPDAERCLVKGAALGMRIAFEDAAQVLRRLRRLAPPPRAEPS